MAENKTEYFLRNINEKLKNRNMFAWKFMFGWVIALPFMLVGTIFTGLDAPEIIGFLFGCAAFMAIMINLIFGVMALYQSTKDTDK